MKKLIKALEAFLAVVVLGAAPAFASPIALQFTGIASGGGSGQGPTETIEGYLTYDPANLESSVGYDDGTYRRYQGEYFASSVRPDLDLVRQTDPLQLHGLAGTESKRVRVGGGLTEDMLIAYVSRNSGPNGLNNYRLSARSFDSSGAMRLIFLDVEDTQGLSSGILTDPDGGLDLAQSVDWFAAGSTATFAIQEYGTSGELLTDFRGNLTSMRTTRVPEPATLALVAGALCCVIAARMRKPVAPTY